MRWKRADEPGPDGPCWTHGIFAEWLSGIAGVGRKVSGVRPQASD